MYEYIYDDDDGPSSAGGRFTGGAIQRPWPGPRSSCQGNKRGLERDLITGILIRCFHTKFVEAKRRENGSQSKSEAGAPNFGGCDWCFHTKNVDAKRSSDFIGGLATVGAE